MRALLMTVAVGGLLAGAGTAQAGCLTGAAVGGVAGHFAGHHGVIGAVAGCAIGHHDANKKKMQRQTQPRESAPDQQPNED